MAIRKRRRSPSPHHHNAILHDDHPRSTSYSSLKYVLLVAAVAILLLVFTVSQRRQSASSTCHLCVEGDGTVRKFRDGDGGLQPLVHADDMREYAREDDAAGVPAEEGHSHICPRLYHEKQTTPLQLMHALNNLMQGNEKVLQEEFEFLAEKFLAKDKNDNLDIMEDGVIQGVASSRGKTVYFIDTIEGLDQESDLLDLRDGRLVGFVVRMKRRLWIAVSPCHGLWYNFDCTKAAPLLFCDGPQSVHMFFHKVVDSGGLIVALRKPRPASQSMIPSRRPPSWTDIGYWKYWLFD